ncbi:MAG: two-component sensor histidine kinase, partial [Cohnella sp.]|nr:two-component sensor histidine kinase [Cohnella sp.]
TGYRLRRLDEPVSLRDELGHVMEYATIQRARFGHRVRLVTEIDETALSAKLPALTIQPLVENAFVHGIENMEAGAEIRVAVNREGEDVVIEVSDNGAGMDETTRQALLQLDYEPSASVAPAPESMSTGLGTRNVFRRLQLFVGRSEVVNIRSSPGQGTMFTIRIPLTSKEEDADVPFADRG